MSGGLCQWLCWQRELSSMISTAWNKLAFPSAPSVFCWSWASSLRVSVRSGPVIQPSGRCVQHIIMLLVCTMFSMCLLMSSVYLSGCHNSQGDASNAFSGSPFARYFSRRLLTRASVSLHSMKFCCVLGYSLGTKQEHPALHSHVLCVVEHAVLHRDLLHS